MHSTMRKFNQYQKIEQDIAKRERIPIFLRLQVVAC